MIRQYTTLHLVPKPAVNWSPGLTTRHSGCPMAPTIAMLLMSRYPVVSSSRIFFRLEVSGCRNWATKNCSVRSAHVYFTSRVIRERRMTWFAQQWTYPQVNRIINEWSTSSATSLSCFTHESLALSLRGRKSGLESAVGGMAVHPKRSFLVSGWLPRKCLLIEQGQEFWPPLWNLKPYIVIHGAIR